MFEKLLKSIGNVWKMYKIWREKKKEKKMVKKEIESLRNLFEKR